MTKGIVKHDFREVTEENAGMTGEKLYVKYGITGIRGQTKRGVPAVMKTGLPTLERGLKEGLPLEQAGCATLSVLMVSTVDTSLIGRSNRKTQFQVAKGIEEILEKNPYPEEDMMEILDRVSTSENLSPGRGAGLLAFTYFLYFLREQQIMGFVTPQVYLNDHRGIKQIKVLLEKEGVTSDKNLDYTCCLEVPDTIWNYFTLTEAQKIIAAIQNPDNVIRYQIKLWDMSSHRAVPIAPLRLLYPVQRPFRHPSMHRPRLPVHDPIEYHRNHCVDKDSHQGWTYNGSRIRASVLAPIRNHAYGCKLQRGYVDNGRCTHLTAGSPRLSGRSSLSGCLSLS